MIRLNGIFRDVYLISKNDVEIRDIFIKTENNNSLILEASIRNLSNEFGGNYKLIADLYNQEDEKVWDFPLEIEYTLDKAITDISLLSKDLGITNSKAKVLITQFYGAMKIHIYTDY